MVSDLNTFFSHKGCKIAAQFIFFIFDEFCLSSRIVLGIGATIRIGREMLCLPYAGFLIQEKAIFKKKKKQSKTDFLGDGFPKSTNIVIGTYFYTDIYLLLTSI